MKFVLVLCSLFVFFVFVFLVSSYFFGSQRLVDLLLGVLVLLGVFMNRRTRQYVIEPEELSLTEDIVEQFSDTTCGQHLVWLLNFGFTVNKKTTFYVNVSCVVLNLTNIGNVIATDSMYLIR